MPRMFSCPQCKEPITTFMSPGESANCGTCGAPQPVPESAIEVGAPVPRPLLQEEREESEEDTLNRRRIRRIAVRVAIPMGAMLFALGWMSTESHDYRHLGALLFYPLQFVATWMFTGQSGMGRPIFSAVLSLPWYPLLAAMLWSNARVLRGLGILLIVVHVIAVLMGLNFWISMQSHP